MARSLNGFGALFIGGFKVEKRVAMYLPADICCRSAVSKRGSESRDSSRCISYPMLELDLRKATMWFPEGMEESQGRKRSGTGICTNQVE